MSYAHSAFGGPARCYDHFAGFMNCMVSVPAGDTSRGPVVPSWSPSLEGPLWGSLAITLPPARPGSGPSSFPPSAFGSPGRRCVTMFVVPHAIAQENAKHPYFCVLEREDYFECLHMSRMVSRSPCCHCLCAMPCHAAAGHAAAGHAARALP